MLFHHSVPDHLKPAKTHPFEFDFFIHGFLLFESILYLDFLNRNKAHVIKIGTIHFSFISSNLSAISVSLSAISARNFG